jgi:hypothetical protein
MEDRLDYSALSGGSTPEESAAFEKFYKSRQRSLSLPHNVAYTMVTVVIGLALGVAIATQGSGSPIVFIGVVAGATALIVPLIIIAEQAGKRRNKRLFVFARRNKLEFTLADRSVDYKGMIFTTGRDREILEALRFPGGLTIGNYEYTTGGPKNRTTYTFGFIHQELSRALPNMVLDAKADNLGGITSLPAYFGKGRRLELEGDFNNYFDLYVPEDYETDALYVFTPDVMQSLVDEGRHYDIEVVDNELDFFKRTRIDITSETEIQRILRMVGSINKELKKQTVLYKDDHESGASSESVARAGRRLKRTLNPRTVAILIGTAAAYALIELVIILTTR